MKVNYIFWLGSVAILFFCLVAILQKNISFYSDGLILKFGLFYGMFATLLGVGIYFFVFKLLMKIKFFKGDCK